LQEAKAQGRIGHVAADPLLTIRAVFDLGGSGAGADAMSIWIVQWVNREIRVLDYIEGVGQVLAYYVNALRSRGWGAAQCILPHDGVNENNLTGKRYEDHVREAGFEVQVIKNQGKGAAMMRVEAARRLFPQIWFNAATTESRARCAGLLPRKERRHAQRRPRPRTRLVKPCGRCFGLMCVAYEEPEQERQEPARRSGGWMG
jgi:phage terminase large subunit